MPGLPPPRHIPTLPGEAIRGPSRSSTALDPEPTAQSDPKRMSGDACYLRATQSQQLEVELWPRWTLAYDADEFSGRSLPVRELLSLPLHACGARMIVIEVFAWLRAKVARCRAGSTRHDSGLL